MTVGDGDKPNDQDKCPGHGPSDREIHYCDGRCQRPIHKPESARKAYDRGFTAGYQARCREETEGYLAALTAGRQIYDRVIRDLVNLKPFSQREADRLATIREGHEGGAHEGGRRGCPWCADDRYSGKSLAELGSIMESSEYRNPGPMCRCSAFAGQHTAYQGSCTGSMLLTGEPHSGHYGAPARKCEHGFIADGQACGEFGCGTCDGCGGPVTAHGMHNNGMTRCPDDPNYGAQNPDYVAPVPLAPGCEAHGQPMIPGRVDPDSGLQEWICACSITYWMGG